MNTKPASIPNKAMNTKTKPTRTPQLIVITVVFLFCCGMTAGAKHMAQQSENRLSKDEIALSLQTESSVLRKEEPYFITVRLKNLSPDEFQLTGKFTLKLEMAGQTEEQKKRLGPNFWSWIPTSDLVPESDIKQRGTLLQGEEVSMQLDLSQLKWGRSILSGLPAKGLIPSIPNGQYELFIEREVRDGNKSEKVRSNVISIRVS